MNYIIDLKDEISGSTADFVEMEIEKAKNAGYKALTLIINSFGGSVYEGLSIISALKNSAMEITAKIEGYCASMAAIIAMCCDKIIMAEHGILMFHNPYLENRESMSESEKVAMQKTANSLLLLASKKVDKKTLKEMMDKETWLDAQEAFSFGMVDELYDINKLSDFNLVEVFNEAIVNKNQNLLNSIYNKLKTGMEEVKETIEEIKNETCIEIEITTESDQEAITEKLLGLENEEEISLEIENPTGEMDYKSLYEELLKKFQEMKNKVEEFEVKETEFNMNRAIEKVQFAINEGRIEENAKSEWVNALQNNYDLGVKMLNTIKISNKSPQLPFMNKTKSVSGEREGWTIRDFEMKDPKALTEMLKNNKPLYKEMFYNYYGVEYNG